MKKSPPYIFLIVLLSLSNSYESLDYEFLKNKYGGSLLSLCDLHVMDEKETLNFVVRAHSDHLWEYLNYFISSNQY